MKNKIPLFLAIFVASLFVIPQVTFAAWWNPVSWKIFNKKPEIKTEQIIIATSTPNKHIIPAEKATTSSKKETSSISSEKKQEYILPKNTGGGSVINGATSGPRPVNPVSSSASSIQAKNTEEIIKIQKQIEQTKSQIEQMAAVSSIWWKTAPSFSTQIYNYRGVAVGIFKLTGDGGYRIKFTNPENNQDILEHIEKTEEAELNKKIEQIVDSHLPKNPAIIAIDAFLLNPTIDNLITFCNIAKTAQGTEQKRVLNETRTDFVMKTLTLYEQSQINNLCNLAFGIRKLKSGEYLSASEFQAFFQWITYDPSYILEFSSNDSDSVREAKINFNNKWKGLSAYKLIGFHTYSTSSEIITPNNVIEKQISRYIMLSGELSNAGVRNWGRMSEDYIIPEKILTEVRRQLINTRR